MRDPRFDPRPGDSLVSSYATLAARMVQHVDKGRVIYWAIAPAYTRERSCGLPQWRAWCARSRVRVESRSDND